MIRTEHNIIRGDSRDMLHIKDSSVQLVVTSPPYWQLKDYGADNQIGFNHSYEEYINNLNLVWKECHRVLENGCRLCVNIGDQFARSVYYGRYKVIPIRTEIIKFCESTGFDYMGAIIWQKQTTTNTTGGASIMGSFPHPRNGIVSIDYEFILLFKKLGKPRRVERNVKDESAMTKEEWRDFFSGHWNFGGARQDGHIAMFPEELPRRLIKMFSFTGETVLDPFLGSGTTSLAAKNLGRNSIGYEINHDYLSFIKNKLGVESHELFPADYHFIEQGEIDSNFQAKIDRMPYVFKDPHDFDRKTDPKKLNFGSKIDKSHSKREDFFSVKEVISPELVKLNNDLMVRLIGVKTNSETKSEAIRFLTLKTKGSKVYLRFDDIKHDDENNLYAYLYLKNKTFLNAHLIKNGLVMVDMNGSYKYKDKFQRMETINV